MKVLFASNSIFPISSRDASYLRLGFNTVRWQNTDINDIRNRAHQYATSFLESVDLGMESGMGPAGACHCVTTWLASIGPGMTSGMGHCC